MSKSMPFTRIEHTFASQGDRMKAWLYLPSDLLKPPVVVMAHGFGAQRWMRLPAYAEVFAQMGMAVFLFDYRGFNDSEGEPRNYVNPKHHLEDWDAAIAYVKSLNNIDSNRIALWGTSFSGGHVIVEAAKHQDISAVVSQIPFTDGMLTQWYFIKTAPLYMIKGMCHSFADVFISLFTKHRHNLRLVGRPGEKFALMCQPDSMDGFLKLVDMDEKEFEKHNFCPGNIGFTMGRYRPISYSDKINCPVLVIAAENDSLLPPTGPKKMAERIKKSSYISLPINHFDAYVDEPFEKLVKVMGDFLKSNLIANS